MIRVIVESPYAGEVAQNKGYARRAMRHSLMRGEAPIASHLLYTQRGVLDDSVPRERLQGIAAGLHWLIVADLHVFYTDRGWSRGMFSALRMNLEGARPDFDLRAMDGEVQLPPRIIINGLSTAGALKLQRMFDDEQAAKDANQQPATRGALPPFLADGI